MHRFILILLALVSLCASTFALQFTLPGFHEAAKKEKCLSIWVAKGQKVKANIKADVGADQHVQMTIKDNTISNNQYFSHNNVRDEKTVFFTQADGDLIACFRSIVTTGAMDQGKVSLITFTMKAGVDTIDYAKIAADQKLKPMEIEVKKVENELDQLNIMLEYLKTSESNMRNLNEYTNARVKHLSILSLLAFVAVGVWYLLYLRHFFKKENI